MQHKAVQAPVSLLLHPDLTPAAKVLWLSLRALPEQSTPIRLATHSGLTLATVRTHLAHLEAVPTEEYSGGTVAIPVDLLPEPRLRPRSKLLYGLLQTLPGFRQNCGAFTHASLSATAQVSAVTVRELVQELAATGWIHATQPHKFAPIEFSLRVPDLDRRRAEVARARHRLEEASFRGEAIMREYLSLLIDSEEFEDNARPGFLVNPLTGERMELDRYYSPTAAFEFNGPQHYRTTERFPSEKALLMLQARDLMKEALCARRGIRVVVVNPEDLNLRTMQQKVATHLPLRDLRGHDELIAFLARISRSYQG